MGREMISLKVFATLSSHNSDEDVRDQALWDDLQKRIEELCAEPRYRPITPMTF